MATAHDGCTDRLVTDRVLWSTDASGYISIERCTGAYCHSGLRCVAPNGLTGFDWIWIGLGVFADVATYAGSAYGKRDELMVDYA